MVRRKKVYEGKAKILFEGPEPGTLIQYFKDDAPVVDQTSEHGDNVADLVVASEGKGVLNNRLSEFFMNGLNSIGMPTHFMRRLSMREQLVRMVDIIPLKITIRNFAAGDISTRLGIPEGMRLPRSLIEYRFKEEALGYPMVSEEHILAFNWAADQDLEDIERIALRANDFLSGVMQAVGVRLMDFTIEVGRIWEGDYMSLIIADEITPDSMRLWDMRAPEGNDGQQVEARPMTDVYAELARRIGVLPSNVTHPSKSSTIN